MGDELGDDFKLKTLWIEHEARKKTEREVITEPKVDNSNKIFGKDVKEWVIWAALISSLGSNDKLQMFLENFVK